MDFDEELDLSDLEYASQTDIQKICEELEISSRALLDEKRWTETVQEKIEKWYPSYVGSPMHKVHKWRRETRHKRKRKVTQQEAREYAKHDPDFYPIAVDFHKALRVCGNRYVLESDHLGVPYLTRQNLRNQRPKPGDAWTNPLLNNRKKIKAWSETMVKVGEIMENYAHVVMTAKIPMEQVIRATGFGEEGVECIMKGQLPKKCEDKAKLLKALKKHKDEIKNMYLQKT